VSRCRQIFRRCARAATAPGAALGILPRFAIPIAIPIAISIAQGTGTASATATLLDATKHLAQGVDFPFVRGLLPLSFLE
jgi:hypothetical protein